MYQYKKTYEHALKLSRALLCNDKRFNNTVVIKAKHGMTHKVIERAFCLLTGEFYVVYSEHESFALYHIDDYEVRQMCYVNIEKDENEGE